MGQAEMSPCWGAVAPASRSRVTEVLLCFTYWINYLVTLTWSWAIPG